MIKWESSEHCQSGRHCRVCLVSPAWREKMAKRYSFDPNPKQFKCPIPVWRRTLRRIKLGTKIARATAAVGISPCEGCLKRKAILDGLEVTTP